jgi:hypothetical protein
MRAVSQFTLGSLLGYVWAMINIQKCMTLSRLSRRSRMTDEWDGMGAREQ